ncbi:peptidase M28 [Halothece sp. PCC 7418]|uniref:M28 family peptidase n=1 Tax=Halothece sp. (strain PCC 7418) TaxID=65093 RepID=UPI0002A06E9F|nr:M28 family peptidase [Halothece sp. PCC 7418]AFZ45066.1 peptidase M28 [Halothece sp. PCC 7418]
MTLKARLHEHLQQIVRDRHPYFSSGGHFYVQQYIREQFQKWGALETHDFEFQGETHHNYVLNLPAENGSEKPPILVAAHYDSVPGTPGADDNGTGVAVLLELMRVFSENPLPIPLRFIAFDLEEYGMVGSEVYAQQLKENNEKIRLMFSLEMLGYCCQEPDSQDYPPLIDRFYPHTGNFIAFVGNLATTQESRFFTRQMRHSGTPSEWLSVPFSGTMIPETRLSDHSPFWDQGYKAMMVTDTSFLRNPHYHQPTDTIETLDLDFLTGVCEGLIFGLQQFSKLSSVF